MQPHPLILLVQDTTFLNYTHHPATRNLGPIGGHQQGLVMHSTLAFTQTIHKVLYFAHPDHDLAACIALNTEWPKHEIICRHIIPIIE